MKQKLNGNKTKIKQIFFKNNENKKNNNKY